MLDIFNLTGKTALVTGATKGLGLAMATGLAKAGANVALVGRSNGDRAVAEARASGVQAEFFQFDLGNINAIPDLLARVTQSMGTVDILVNNAGLQKRHPAVDFPLADWDELVRVNMSAVFFMCQAFGKGMVERGAGKIINIASLLSFQGGLTVPAYAASKGAVAQFTKSLANEWAGKGVNVNAIAPGYMDTEMNTALKADPVRSRQIMDRIPAGRWGRPEDMVGALVYLASGASDYVNGSILVVDGGWMGR